ncbi:MAG: hypothetical protein HXX10_23865 [Rhodoplanes sp.]|uniref:hypothetical protein n=1 Tax=Rhodoplanes sp. TaxID=1968906 RepID=UPI00181B5A56|nr:hypothetical protein [Rhodoplanes sp.]NVO17073.1 hypothetical protein [Rhodoplanes sp.]
MPHLVASAIVIGVLTTTAGVASAASIKTDWHDESLTSDRIRQDAERTIFLPLYLSPGCGDVADARVF